MEADASAALHVVDDEGLRTRGRLVASPHGSHALRVIVLAHCVHQRVVRPRPAVRLAKHDDLARGREERWVDRWRDRC